MSDRKKVTRRLDSITYDSLETVIKRVDEIISRHTELSYKDFEIDSYYEYGDETRPYLEYQTDETDEEMNKRLAFEDTLKKSNEERERLYYEQLKKRFG